MNKNWGRFMVGLIVTLGFLLGLGCHIRGFWTILDWHSKAAYWKFDENAGFTAYDETNHNNDGMLMPTDKGPTWGTGVSGSALYFNGNDDYVDIGTSSTLNVAGNDFTVEAWIKTNMVGGSASSTNGEIRHIIEVTGFARKYFLAMGRPYGDPDKIAFGVGGSNAVAWYYNVGPNLNDNRWHHIIVTKLGTAITFYIDGALVEGPVSHRISPSLFLSNRIGRGFSGSIDEVAIYNYALTAREVINRYNAQPPQFSFLGLESATDAQIGGAVNLVWKEATDSSIPVTYNIYYATDSEGQDWGNPEVRNIYGTSCQVTGLDNDVDYYFVVRAKNVSGNEEENTREFAARPTDTTPPQFEGLESATYMEFNHIVILGWSEAVDNSPPIHYFIYDDLNYPPFFDNGNGTELALDGLAYKPYGFSVRARDNFGNEDQNTVRLTVTPTDPYVAAYWPFNSDDPMHDEVNQNHGTPCGTGPIYTDQDGVRGGGMSFDGASGIEVPDSASFHSYQITLELWVRVEWQSPTSHEIHELITKADSYNNVDNEWQLRIQPDQVRFSLYDTYNVAHFLTVYRDFTQSNWIYLVATYDGQEMKVYINGELQSPTQPDTMDIRNGTHPVVIGWDASRVSGYALHGSIDEVVIYNRALTDDEIWYRYRPHPYNDIKPAAYQ